MRKAIPPKVKEILRSEVGFGCPVKGCGNPYLEYHHFDPPVSVRPHNEPRGMIALCAQHHKKADGGAYTIEQLHALKSDRTNAKFVKGNLEWLRRDLLAVVGGIFYYETPRIIVIDGHELVSLKRDDEGYLRLSINMLSINAEERLVVEDNSWENIGSPIDLRCPPQGKELEVKYANGDFLYLKFLELNSSDEASRRYKNDVLKDNDSVKFPITAVEVNMNIGGTNIQLSPESTTFGGGQINGGLMSHCGCGIRLDGTGVIWAQNPKWKLAQRIELIDGTNVIKVKFGK
ncbi:HNH endonuclease [Pseudomonas tumuqii]|uniref:HNH endonuclease n=1 Tax=Pseudomonas tumuqii TaxID=2715755 RepID=UPI001556721C|nr:HNH endonuclease [Pseudomonas tumuqii]